MSESKLMRGASAVCITMAPYAGPSSVGPSRDIFNADTARAQLECESRMNRYGSHCTCGIHDAARRSVSAIES